MYFEKGTLLRALVGSPVETAFPSPSGTKSILSSRPWPFALVILGIAVFLPGAQRAAAEAVPGWEVLPAPSGEAGCVAIVSGKTDAPIVVDAKDFPVVGLA